MSYIGNNLQVAYPSYLIIDDISSQFNGVLKTFALRVAGSTPVPFPINPQQCLISVNNIVQKPDSTGVSGFTLTGSNIVFATAPTAGWSFFGTILAGADYVNVGANFPSGTAAIPSITFDQSTGTGLFLASSNVLGITTGGVQRLVVNSSGFVGIGTSSPSHQLDVVSAATSVAEFNGPANAIVEFKGSGFVEGKIQCGAEFIIGSTNNYPVAFVANGTERLRITSAGLVGIGTNSPGNKLAVIGSTGVLADSSIRVNGTAGTSSANSGLWLSGNQSTSHYNWLVGSQYNVNAALEITPSTAIDGSTFSTPTAVFTQTGRVGIGNNAPSFELDLGKDSAVQNYTQRIITGGSYSAASRYDLNGIGTFTVGFNNSGGIVNNAPNGAASLWMQQAYPIVFGTNGAERARIDSSGNLNLGQSLSALQSGGTGLTVYGSTSSEIKFLNSTTGVTSTDGTALVASGLDFTLNNREAGNLIFGTSNTERARINSSGRVGIGTSAPWTSGILDCFGNAKFGASSTNGLYLGITSGTPYIQGYDTTTPSSSVLAFYGGSSEAMRIDSSGRLLVGTSSKSATTSTTAKGVIGIGGGGALICAEGQVANNDTIDITVSTGGLHYFTGLLQVNNINAASGATNTQSLISVLGNTQGGTITTSTLHTATPGGGQSFTITYVATGILRFTNTSGSTCNVQISYTGGGVNAS